MRNLIRYPRPLKHRITMQVMVANGPVFYGDFESRTFHNTPLEDLVTQQVRIAAV